MGRVIELVVTDLDRTLWGPDERVHERTLDALHVLERRGVPVLVATGRRRRSAEEALARSDIVLPAVVLDGAMGRDLRDGAAFFDAAFAPTEAARVLGAFLAAGVEPAVYVDLPGTDVVVGDRPATHQVHMDHIGPWLGREDLQRVVAEEQVYGFAVVGGPLPALRAARQGLEGAGRAVIVENVFFPGWTLTVRPPSTSKWEGVLAFCERYGHDPAGVLAVGDGENDIELLEGAAVACVVEDGCDAALALADHVIGCADTGGWAGVLDFV